MVTFPVFTSLELVVDAKVASSSFLYSLYNFKQLYYLSIAKSDSDEDNMG